MSAKLLRFHEAEAGAGPPDSTPQCVSPYPDAAAYSAQPTTLRCPVAPPRPVLPPGAAARYRVVLAVSTRRPRSHRAQSALAGVPVQRVSAAHCNRQQTY